MPKIRFDQIDSIDDGLIVDGDNDRLEIRIIDDYYGDSETGFGAELNFVLYGDDVQKLKTFFSNLL